MPAEPRGVEGFLHQSQHDNGTEDDREAPAHATRPFSFVDDTCMSSHRIISKEVAAACISPTRH